MTRRCSSLISSDDGCAGEKGPPDRLARPAAIAGTSYVDHHVFFCLRHEKTGLNRLLRWGRRTLPMSAIGPQLPDQVRQLRDLWGLGRHLLGGGVYGDWANLRGTVHRALGRQRRAEAPQSRWTPRGRQRKR